MEGDIVEYFVYRFHAELKGYRPKVRRLFDIGGDMTMAELGYAVQLMFEMQACHSFCFRENRRDELMAKLHAYYSDEEAAEILEKHYLYDTEKNYRYEFPRADLCIAEGEQLIGMGSRLRDLALSSDWNLTFEYDEGDGWQVDLTLVSRELRKVNLDDLPCVLEGAGFGIVEDVGGTGGLAKLAKALRKGSGKAYDDYCAWLDSSSLDLGAFDIDDMNWRLKKLIRVYREIYERLNEPSDKERGVMLRDYLGKGSRGY
jgi:hypothetical protein